MIDKLSEKFIKAYTQHLDEQQSLKGATLKIIKLKFTPAFHRSHQRLIDVWVNNCNLIFKPDQYGINYLQPSNRENEFDGLALLLNNHNTDQLFLSNDSNILGESQLVHALYEENESISVDIQDIADPKLALSNIRTTYFEELLTNPITLTLKIEHTSPKYYTKKIRNEYLDVL